MIRVLMVLTGKLGFNGIANSVMNYYRNIDSEVVRIDFVTSEVTNELNEEILSTGGQVFLLPYRNRNPLKYVYDLKKIIKKNEYDIVHAHGNSATLFLDLYAAKLAGCDIRIAHSRNTFGNFKVIDKLLRPLFYKTYTHGFACGEDAGKWLFDGRHFDVIPNGTQIDKFMFNEKVRNEVRTEYGLTKKKIVGHLGNINYQKNHDYLVDVFNELIKMDSDYFLVLIGDGPLRSEVEQKLEGYGLLDKTLIVGKTLEVSKWLQCVDFIVFPSRYEGLPNAIVEAQIAGLNCIISDVITQEVNITGLVDYLSLDYSPKKWAEVINQIDIPNRSDTKNKIIEVATEKGYNIEENARNLQNRYIEFLKNN